MQPPTKNLWKRYPGYDDGIDSDESQEEHLRAVAGKRLPEILRALGPEWTEAPCVKFDAAGAPKGSAGASEGGRPVLAVPALPSQWGNVGPPPKFRIERIRAPAVRETFEQNGLRASSGQDWLIQWSGPGMKESGYQGLHEYQRVNHFPGSSELTQKDRMWNHFHKMARRFGTAAFDFCPQTFVLPEQTEEFLEVYKTSKHVWIVKPHASSQGRGIFLLRDLKEMPIKDVSVISRYIDNPLLIQQLKFDLRIYVLVTSYEPLRIHIYREGLTRFASKPYSTDEEHLKDAYRHLTNYSINKFAANFKENQQLNADNVGHKWSLSALNRHLECVGIDTDLMWTRIHDIIIKTLLSVEPVIAAKTRKNTNHAGNCFELYGFDVLVDDQLKPWLIEVNLSPCMNADSPLDWQVKSSLLSDTFNLVGIRRADYQTVTAARMRTRLMQLRKLSKNMSNQRGPMPPPQHVRQQHPPSDDRKTDSEASAADASVKVTKADAPQARGDERDRDNSAMSDIMEPVVLDALTVNQLKALVHSLQEVGRRKNFIRLYPTRATVKRYASIVSARTGAASRAMASQSSESDKTSRAIPQARSMSQVLASILFGPSPIRASGAAAQIAPAVELEDDLALLASDEAEIVGAGEEEEEEGEEREEEEKIDEGAEQDEVPEQQEGLLNASATKKRGNWKSAIKVSCTPTAGSDPNTVSVAEQALTVLGSKVGSRLAFMEYLIRICNVCAGLSTTVRARVVESHASKIAAFRKQLAFYVRTTVRAQYEPPSTPPEVASGPSVLGRSRSGGYLNFTSGNALGSSSKPLVDRLAAVCKTVLARLVRDAWGVAVSIDWSTLSTGGSGGLTLGQCSPSAFVQTGSGNRVVRALVSLSIADLEGLLQGPFCSPEFRALLQEPGTADPVASFVQHEVAAFREGGQRPSSGYLRKRIQEWWCAPTGPLGELVQLTAPVTEAATTTEAEQPPLGRPASREGSRRLELPVITESPGGSGRRLASSRGGSASMPSLPQTAALIMALPVDESGSGTTLWRRPNATPTVAAAASAVSGGLVPPSGVRWKSRHHYGVGGGGGGLGGGGGGVGGVTKPTAGQQAASVFGQMDIEL
eukprot:TRINITY_DN27797_c1_g1_i1.p1 TRINITY_DN27797_c1_g1~~TRINITY_DN27797_c1_g1_i1.p1  ORF type:complete len:1102 (+),score=198.01 TRINITY_DN27797_c1_g1_i1:147-3452(+)